MAYIAVRARKHHRREISGHGLNVTAQAESGNYRGEIIGETELHIVQRLSPHSAVAHMKNLLRLRRA